VTAACRGPSLAEVLPGVSAVIHHGSLSTAEAALAAGRPQVALPRHLEQELTARALADLGVGRALTGKFPVDAVGQALRNVLVPGGIPDRAMKMARDLDARPYEGCLIPIVDRCLGWLS
jgi:UDP:flavonoid glycosyltransferase YjiC (YdhE family)